MKQHTSAGGIHLANMLVFRTTVCVGFTTKNVSLARPPGWETDSYGYHGDDGTICAGQNVGKHYGPPFSATDVVGCGINFRTGTAFFTKNGVNLGLCLPPTLSCGLSWRN